MERPRLGSVLIMVFGVALVWGGLTGQAGGQDMSAYVRARQTTLAAPQHRLAAAVRAAAQMLAQPEPAPRGNLMLNRAQQQGRERELEVYVYAARLGAAEIGMLQQIGAHIHQVDVPARLVYASVGVDALEHLAALPFVRWVGPPAYTRLKVGSVTSEGDTAMRVAQARAALGADGTGVSVGIISDSLLGLPASVQSGDLPADTRIVNGQDGRTLEDPSDEGRAMAEIVYDLAPGAALQFHSGFPTSVDTIAAVRALTAAGAQVIVDDILTFFEPVFEDGPLARAVQEAIDQGVIYVTAAGNSADQHYRGTFREFDPNDGDAVLNWHDFGDGDTALSVTVAPGDSLQAVLQWASPFDGSGMDDYDLLVFDAGGTVAQFDSSGNCTGVGLRGTCAGLEHQNTTNAPPLEVVFVENTSLSPLTVTLRINRVTGAALPLVLLFNQEAVPLEHNVSRGSTFGHQCIRDVLAVGAVNANDPGFDTIERFSSRGPCEVFVPTYESRLKPDVVAADGVMTSVPGFQPFFGTSAAAPHVAAVAAVLLHAAGGPGVVPPAQIADLIRLAAVDRGLAGIDPVYGYGVVDAVRAGEALGVLRAGGNLAPRGTIASPDTDVVIVPGEAVVFQGDCVDAQASDFLTYAWTFGGGAPPSNLLQPGGVVLPAPGVFTATFTCTDAAGVSTPVVSRQVTVNQPPRSRITQPAANVTASVGGTVDFAGVCSDSENHTPFTYLWSFGGGGDAASSTLPQVPRVRFDTPGTFVVTFRCTDALGTSDTQPATVQVQVLEARDSGGGGGGGGCSVLAGARRGGTSPLAALGNGGLPLVVLGGMSLWRWWRRRRVMHLPR